MTETKQMMLADRILSTGLTAEVTFMGESTRDGGILYLDYDVRLLMDGRHVSIDYSTGIGWDRPPNVEEIMESVLSDAATVGQSNGFEEWARDLGLDPDSRSAEAVYHACEVLAGKLAFLLLDRYDDFLWHTTREG